MCNCKSPECFFCSGNREELDDEQYIPWWCR